jgi:hypothetical protein
MMRHARVHSEEGDDDNPTFQLNARLFPRTVKSQNAGSINHTMKSTLRQSAWFWVPHSRNPHE